MKRVSPQVLVQSRPVISSICISIYAGSRSALETSIEEARLTALRDHERPQVERAFAGIDDWLNTSSFLNVRYPLAIFSSVGFSGMTYLPSIPKNLAIVATSFHIKPLLKWLQREKSFLVMSFEPKAVLIYLGSLTQIKLIESFRFTSELSADQHLAKAYKVTKDSVSGLNLPIILAGPEKITKKFRSIVRSKRVVPDTIDDAEQLETTVALHAAAVKVLEPFMRRSEDSLIRRYWRAHNVGAATSSLAELVSLGLQGQIKHLFVSEKMNLWGQINYRTGKFTYSQTQADSFDDCVLDDLSEIVIYHGGTVTVLPSERMPNGHAACGIIKQSATHSLKENNDEGRIQEFRAV